MLHHSQAFLLVLRLISAQFRAFDGFKAQIGQYLTIEDSQELRTCTDTKRKALLWWSIDFWSKKSKFHTRYFSAAFPLVFIHWDDIIDDKSSTLSSQWIKSRGNQCKKYRVLNLLFFDSKIDASPQQSLSFGVAGSFRDLLRLCLAATLKLSCMWRLKGGRSSGLPQTPKERLCCGEASIFEAKRANSIRHTIFFALVSPWFYSLRR